MFGVDPFKYVDIECPNCGRNRVEEYHDGALICEKCHWNIKEEEYDTRTGETSYSIVYEGLEEL